MGRRVRRSLARLLAGWMLGAGIARAQQSLPSSPPPLPPPQLRIAPTFEALHVAASELPASWKLAGELDVATRGPRKLLDLLTFDTDFPRPLRRDVQTISDGATTAEILYLDWGARLPDVVGDCLEKTLRDVGRERNLGEERQGCPRVATLFVRHGGVVVIANAPAQSQAGRFVVERWRHRFGFRKSHDHGPAEPLLHRLRNFNCYGDVAHSRRGLDLFDGHASELAGIAEAAIFEGLLAGSAGDRPRAERAFARALELDATVDPLASEWELDYVHDLHADALVRLGRCDEALREVLGVLSRNYAVESACERAKLLYRAAACHAGAGRPDEAIAALAECVEFDADFKQRALVDEDFTTLRGRPAYEALVAGAIPPQAPTDHRARGAVR